MARVRAWVLRLGRAGVRAVGADRLLRAMFRVDQLLYRLESRLAIAYGGGVHTKHRHTRYHEFFIRRIGNGERVVDVGCGMGALAHDIAERAGATVLAIDRDAESIAVAKLRFLHPRITYQLGDVTDGLAIGECEVAVLSNVLEHLRDRPTFLQQLMKSASPGRLLIRVPLFERDWRVPLRRELGVEWRLDPTHETEYTVESFGEEMALAGLTIRHIEIRWGEIWAEVVPIGSPDEPGQTAELQDA